MTAVLTNAWPKAPACSALLAKGLIKIKTVFVKLDASHIE
jgi:hypothetical protein